MWMLYHTPLSPFCRKVRIVLAEKQQPFDLEAMEPWTRPPELLSLNPAGEVPVLIDAEGRAFSDSGTICEYIEELHPEPIRLYGETPQDRAEVRRLVAWFDRKFDHEVTRNLVGEKINKRLAGGGEPDSRLLRAGYANIRTHLDYISWLEGRRKWLAGDCLSMADIAAAAHVSAVDYVGAVPWDDFPAAKDWYVRMKSRPSFRPLLSDYIAFCPPPKHYADLDF